jgi:hypothetical protein
MLISSQYYSLYANFYFLTLSYITIQLDRKEIIYFVLTINYFDMKNTNNRYFY